MKIVFFGTSEFAVPSLKLLHDTGYMISAVVTVPDAPAGRERILTPPPIKQVADSLGLTVLQPATLKHDEFFEEFTKLNPELCIVAAYGKIIPQRYLDVPKHGFINIHPSLLPLYRGATPIQSAILNGETETAVTIMQVDAEMDHGAILKQTTYDLQPTKNYKEIHDELAEIGAKLLIETIPDYISGKIKPIEQDHSQATFTKFFSRLNAHIDWSQTAKQVYDTIRALNPEPGTWAMYRGVIMNIKTARIMNHEARITAEKQNSGTIIKQDKTIGVICGDGNILELDTIQLEGKKETTALEFSHGHHDFVGSEFK